MRLFILATVVLGACGGGHHHPETSASTAPANPSLAPAVARGIARARAATARFASLDTAVAVGYQRTVTECIANEPAGTMGFHHVNRSLLDDLLDVEQPEILVYEKLPDGRYRLNGVEYIVPYRVRPADATPPQILGQKLKRADRLDLWYLHVWLFQENPRGIFADWNPTVHCPAAS